MKQTSARSKVRRSKSRGSHAKPAAAEGGFAERAEAVLKQMRASMIRLIEALPSPIDRAVDVQRALGVYAPLAWRVFRIAGSEDVLECAKFAPGPGHVTTLLQAAERKGVAKSVISDVREAMDAFEGLRKAHSGSREQLTAMVASLRPSETDLISVKCRRAAFEQNSLIWGVQTDVNVGCAIYTQGTGSGPWNITLVTGRVGYQAVRPGAAQNYIATAAPDLSSVVDPGRWIDVDLLKEFCSHSLATRTWQDESGQTHTKVARTGIGKQSAFRHFHVKGADLDANEPFELDWGIATPVRLAHLDLMIPAAWRPRLNPVRVYASEGGLDVARQHRLTDVLPMSVHAVHIGTSTDVPDAPGVPRYTEMVRKVLQHRGHAGTEFEVYRCRIPFPVLHSLVRVEVLVDPIGGG